ncbi:hypothetical protein KUCAC02_008555 [Chaenocephalus aceratus]|uniref:Uncharacterized protein n=1 Tax=Chaenocephalus aceratus TaxID=36190 RepID=A0ACB9WRE2_CHAAC|nr:hypothetical protein KUCAC02_008555 [Chaenocephalus aceratus]
MHHNENAGRDQATTAAGKLVFKLAYPKSKRGECTVKPVKNDPTYIYVDELTRLVFHKVFLDPTPFVDELKLIHVPEDLSTQFDRSPKEEMIVSRFSRFPPKEVEILHSTTEPTDIRTLVLRGLPIILGDNPTDFYKAGSDTDDEDSFRDIAMGSSWLSMKVLVPHLPCIAVQPR